MRAQRTATVLEPPRGPRVSHRVRAPGMIAGRHVIGCFFSSCRPAVRASKSKAHGMLCSLPGRRVIGGLASVHSPSVSVHSSADAEDVPVFFFLKSYQDACCFLFSLKLDPVTLSHAEKEAIPSTRSHSSWVQIRCAISSSITSPSLFFWSGITSPS